MKRNFARRNGKIEPCPACGQNVRPGIRKVPHQETAECKAALVVRAYRERGWVPTTTQWAGVLERAGVPVEKGLGAWHIQDYAETDDAGRITRKWSRDEQHEIYFAPEGGCVIMALMARRRITPTLRGRVAKAIWDKPELIAAVESAIRMGGTLTSKFLYSLVEAAAEQKAC